MRAKLAAGELDELVFEACVFRAVYPNRNYLRFRDEDLEAFAASFVGQPFLRDHNSYELEARGGTVRGSWLEGVVGATDGGAPTELMQRIALTVPRDIEAFLNQTIDRFSIGWYWTPPLCSVCGTEWLSRECNHWPGRKYAGGDGGKREALCELVFVAPAGKETSAVNAPAVGGTGVRGVLAELMAAKESLLCYAMAPRDRNLGRVEGWMRRPGIRGQGSGVSSQASGGRSPRGCFAIREQRVADSSRDGDAGRAGGRGGGCAGRAAVAPPAPGLDATLAVVQELAEAQRVAVLDNRLAASGLPVALQESVRATLPAGWRVGDLDRLIEVQRSLWAALEAERTVQGHDTPRDGRITGLVTGLDQLTEALGALMDGVRPRNARPLSGLREAYVLLSGDYEMTGKFHRDRVTLAAVDSTTMASIVADLLNKRVVNEFQKYPRWWEPICRQEDFATLQTIQWITLGGIGALPTVAEGAAYTELAWDDSKETATWAKKGGYVGITLEAMDKDDVGRLRSAPQALAQSAYLTLGRAVAGLFTMNSGVGPTMADGGALFNATAVSTPGGHANLLTTALSANAWAAVKLAMRKQAELNSGERLGGLVVPKFLLVPPDLENTALTVLASEGLPGTANNDINPEAEGNTHDARLAAARRRLIVVDFWPDATDWAAVADPALYPTIGIGYRYGRTPEIFSVAAENNGLMFTNDVMPVKVRWFYAVGARGLAGPFQEQRGRGLSVTRGRGDTGTRRCSASDTGTW